MIPPVRFSYIQKSGTTGAIGYVPLLPILLENRGQIANINGLLDTGASINVLPYSIGLQLGFVWENEVISMPLSGNLGSVPTRIVLVTGTVATFPSARLAFAWAKTDEIPLLLGQMNFFAEFDVCFFRSHLAFEVTPKRP